MSNGNWFQQAKREVSLELTNWSDLRAELRTNYLLLRAIFPKKWGYCTDSSQLPMTKLENKGANY